MAQTLYRVKLEGHSAEHEVRVTVEVIGAIGDKSKVDIGDALCADISEHAARLGIPLVESAETAIKLRQ